MDFTLNEQEEAIRTMASKFAKVELKKVAIEVEENDQPPSRDIVRKFAKQGLLGVNLQTKYGGGGLGHLEAVLVLEEIAKLSIASAFPVFESCFGPILAIEHFGPEEMRKRIIPQVCNGEAIVAVAMSEPEAGSALTDLNTQLEKEMNGFCPEQKDGVQEQGMQIFTLFTAECQVKRELKALDQYWFQRIRLELVLVKKKNIWGLGVFLQRTFTLMKWLSSMKM